MDPKNKRIQSLCSKLIQMENYRKTSTKAVECPELIISGPHIRISANGKIKDYVAVFEKFKKQDESTITITGVGMAVNKTVSAVEVIKRNHKVLIESSIFAVAEVDIWDSVDGTLDSLQVTRNLPGIKFVVKAI